MPIKRIGTVSKCWFSKKYLKLPRRERIKVRKKMNSEIKRIFSEVENAAEEATKFNKRLSETFQAMTANKPVRIELRQEKAVRHRLFEELKRLRKEAGEFQKWAEPWFWGLDPALSRLERFSINSIEDWMHAIGRELKDIGQFNTCLESASKHLELIEKRLIKRKP